MTSALQSGPIPMQCTPPASHGKATHIFATTPHGQIEIDFVNVGTTKVTPPFVDCDIDNLLVNRSGLQLKVAGAGGKICQLAQSVEHCKKGWFVFFYSPNGDKDVFRYRMRKLLSKNFVCLNPFPDSVKSQFSQYAGQFQPDSNFNADFSNLPAHLQ
ncbi:hypothetical protein GEMRC1_007662 [Eukaryota sp. GEM-RC1]